MAGKWGNNILQNVCRWHTEHSSPERNKRNNNQNYVNNFDEHLEFKIYEEINKSLN
jgi:hypothetical protein